MSSAWKTITHTTNILYVAVVIIERDGILSQQTLFKPEMFQVPPLQSVTSSELTKNHWTVTSDGTCIFYPQWHENTLFQAQAFRLTRVLLSSTMAYLLTK